MRDRWDTNPARGRRPLTMLLIGACVLVGVLTSLGENRGEVFQALSFAPRPTTIFEQFSWSPLGAIKSGEVWRLVTPIFLHFGPWHLVLNMFMLYPFGSLIEARRGSLRLALIVLTVAITSNFAQYYFPTHFEHVAGESAVRFGGMSGVVFGLLGYMWMKSRFDPRVQVFIAPNVVTSLLIWLALGWSGLITKIFGIYIANWVHTVGLLTGMAIGIAPVVWRRLFK
jgi:GlpG protein